jgi:hypothetical protein
VTVTLRGDSTQAGLVRPNNLDADAYYSQQSAPWADPVFLKSMLPSAGIVVSDDAQPGSALGLNVSGQDATLATIAAETAVDTNIFSVENWGINNAYWISRGYAAEAQFESDLRQYVTVQRAYGKTPILEEPNPICNDAAQSAVLDDLVVIIDQVSIDMRVPLVSQYKYIKALPNWQSMLSDCVHPSDQLYKLKSQRQAYAIAMLASR